MPVPTLLRRLAGATLVAILVTPLALGAAARSSGAGPMATRAGAACCGDMACCVARAAEAATAEAASCGAGHCATKGATALGGATSGANSARFVAGCPGPPPALQPGSGDPIVIATFAGVPSPARPASDLGSAGVGHPEPLAERPPSPPPRFA